MKKPGFCSGKFRLNTQVSDAVNAELFVNQAAMVKFTNVLAEILQMRIITLLLIFCTWDNIGVHALAKSVIFKRKGNY